MKHSYFICLLVLNLYCLGQKKFQTVFNSDSLTGFNEPMSKSKAFKENMFGKEFHSYMSREKRNFINTKYNITTQSPNTFNQRPLSSNNQVMVPCTNMDFEAGNLTGWTQTNGINGNSNTMAGCCASAGGNAVMISGGTDPLTGISLNSPLGGSWVCQVNNQTTGGYTDRISQTFNVTAANSLVQFAYLAVLQSAGHACSDQPYMNIRLIDCSNNVIACPQVDIQEGAGCGTAAGFVNGPGYSYTNAWQVSALDLTPYIGSCITIQVTAGACTQGGHWGYGYFDAQCMPMNITVNNVQFPVGTSATTVSICGALTATVSAPPGLGPYLWNGPAGSGVTNVANQTFTTNTAGIYTITMNPVGACAPIIRLVDLQVSMPPIAGFNFTNTACINSVSCVSTSSIGSGPAITGLQWVWGDASPNSTGNPASHTYLASGPNQIKLVITNSAGCKDSIVKNISITQKPTAGFTVNPACMGSALNFTNTSTTPSGSNNSAWDFGDASGSIVTSPAHNYAASGIFSVTLVITNTDLCKDSVKKIVNVYGRAVVNFTPTGVCFGTATNFTNTTSTVVNPNTGGIGTYSWSFGNGGTSAVQNPVYTYTSLANQTANTIYSVSLYVITVNGCKDSLTKQVTVYSLPTPNFTADSVCLGSTTTLTDLSNNNGNPFFLFSWDFNSDNVSDLSNNAVSSTTVFSNPGNTSVTYTVFTSPNGGILTCSDKITKNVWVHASPLAVITHTNKCIDAQPNLMSGVNSTLAIGTITNYAWNYGNGNNNLINPIAPSSFSYNVAGNYIVTLTVTSSGGCSNVTTQAIDVWERPYANYSYSKACAGKQIILKGIQLPASAPISNFDWDLNNTVSTAEASGAQITYTYNTPGFQPINLLITSNQGCKNVVPGNIYINYNPKPIFYAPKRVGCTDLCIPIFDSTQAIPGPAKNTNWEWDFGNGSINITANSGTQYVCYSNPSNLMVKDFNVKLIVTTDSGCVDSVRKAKYIRVYPKPKADFEWSGKDGDLLTPAIAFQNTSIGYNRFYWYYNDGVNVTDSTNQNPLHYYATDIPRDFQVFLAVRNQYGCKDTTSKYVEIGPEYTFYIPNTFTPNDDGTNEFFTGTGVGIKGFKMWIYDRWGEKLFYTDDIKKGWDASVKGKYGKEKEDVYAYRVLVTDLWNKEHEYVGHVNLIK
ncbi:MAG: PKD domain-containing protein [Bacteroidetes bacterium]|nr:PKD domain-containing protein [Bacteroidota bacterium]